MEVLSITLGVLTYRRPDLLNELLCSFMRQKGSTDFRIIVYDNDPTGSAEVISKNCVPIEQLRYVRANENSGSSGGFNCLFAEALKESSSHFFCCDDDIELTDDCIQRLIEVARDMPKSVLLGGRRYLSGREFKWAPIVTANDVTQVQSHRQMSNQSVPVDTITFEGCMFPLSVIREVGLPYRSFYIDGDDWDYGLRIRKFGHEILRISATTIIRKIEPKEILSRIPLLGLGSVRSGLSPERTYYEVRNKFKLVHRHANQRVPALLRETGRALRRLLGIVAFDDRKLFRSLLIMIAVVHGWTNFEGRYDRLRM